MDSFYERLVKSSVKGNIIAEKFIMDREVFDNEIAKSLMRIYSDQIEDKINFLPSPELTFDFEFNFDSMIDETKTAIEDLFKDKATEEQIKRLTQKYKEKIASAKWYNTPKGKEKSRKASADWYDRNKERKKD